MKSISAKDASFLTIPACSPGITDEMAERCLAAMEDEEAKIIFQATRELGCKKPYSRNYTSDQIKAAEALLDWAEENRRISAEMQRRGPSRDTRGLAELWRQFPNGPDVVP